MNKNSTKEIINQLHNSQNMPLESTKNSVLQMYVQYELDFCSTVGVVSLGYKFSSFHNTSITATHTVGTRLSIWAYYFIIKSLFCYISDAIPVVIVNHATQFFFKIYFIPVFSVSGKEIHCRLAGPVAERGNYRSTPLYEANRRQDVCLSPQHQEMD